MSIRFEAVSKSFGTKAILKNVSFEVSSGEILFILGKSGVGKSVTLKHIVGVHKPDPVVLQTQSGPITQRGKVFVDDQDVTQASPSELASIRRKCGMVFQHPALLDSLTVLENVAFGLRSSDTSCKSKTGSKLTEEEIREIVIKKLSLVNLGSDILYKMPTEISYGMQKRVSLARTLAPNPSYLLFDEPTTGLDPITTQFVNDLIFDLSRKLKVTSIVVSHDMACALKIADKILVLDQGQILAHSSVSDIRKSKEPLIQSFLSEMTDFIPPSTIQPDGQPDSIPAGQLPKRGPE